MTIINTGAYKPVIVEANKISSNPTIVDSTKKLPVNGYGINSKKVMAIEVNAYTSAGANAWTTYIAANVGGTIISDGWNVRANATTATQTLTLYTSNGGNNAPGTFTS